jgi:peptidyl-prolyl cis-trans isomerase B (cyclophilin B)
MGKNPYSNKGVNSAAKSQAAAQEQAQMRGLIITVAAVALVVIALVLVFVLQEKPVEVDMSAIQAEIDSMQVSDFTETDKTTDYVKITVKDHGDIIVRLREDIAPITVKNFKGLVGDKFYDGLTFHRIMKDFMIQGGDPKGDGTGGSGVTIKGEFETNGVRNDLSHITGVISMARRSSPMDSATSQFFICNANASASLDGSYAAFGYVVAGLDTVMSVSDVEVTSNGRENSKPVSPVVIESIRFVTPN